MTDLFAQLGAAVPTSPAELITSSTAATKIVLVILALLSILSWALMIAKTIEFRGAEEADRLGRFVPSLATIGSVSPLIGLLGTVLGVIDAFIGIATKGSGNLGAVAPGVAEALIATAAALAVAIPAVFGYNILAHRLNRFDGELESFASELIALMVREGRI